MGVHTKFRPEYTQKLIDYFTEHEPSEIIIQPDGSKKLQVNHLPMFEHFAKMIGVSTTALDGWATETDKIKNPKTGEFTEKLRHPDFHAAMALARDTQKRFLATNGLEGHYSASFTAFLGRNMVGWRDHKDIELSSDPNRPILNKIEVVWTEKAQEPKK